MKFFNYGIVAVAGLTIAAAAGTSRLEIQVSKDGNIWSNAVTVNHNAGDTGRVLVRYSMNWVAADSDTAVPVGFASTVFQPTFANVRAADVIAPFVATGNNNAGAINLDASPLNGPFGRLRPFGLTGPAATNPASSGNHYAVISHTLGSGGAPDDSFYRIARNDITRWMGTGPSTGAAARNNFNGSGGIAVVQTGSRNVESSDPAFNGSIQNVILMQIAFDVAAIGSGSSHTIDLDVPIAGLGGRNQTTGLREAFWFASAADSFGNIKGVVSVGAGQINTIPAPSAFVLLGLGSIVAGLRRRR